MIIQAPAPVEPICVTIDKYQTPDQQFNIYLFGDAHIGHPASLRQEQADFLNAAHTKNAFVIVEDLSHYDGNNLGAKRYAHLTSISSSPDKIKTGLSSLVNITRNGINQSIPFFNAECRHGITYAEAIDNTLFYESEHGRLAAETADLITQAKTEKNSWLSEYYYNNRWFALPRDALYWHLQKTTDAQDMALDARMLCALYDLMRQETAQLSYLLISPEHKKSWLEKPTPPCHNTKNIFVVAGLNHIRYIARILKEYAHSTHTYIDGYKQSVDQENFIDRIYLDMYTMESHVHSNKPENSGKIKNQKMAQQFVNTYQINITDFFTHEIKQRHPILASKQSLSDKPDTPSCQNNNQDTV